MKNKKFYYLLIIIILFINKCTTKENDCITISNKKIINGLYVFYWDKDGIDFDSNNSDFPLVFKIYQDQEVFLNQIMNHSIGDKYCSLNEVINKIYEK